MEKNFIINDDVAMLEAVCYSLPSLKNVLLIRAFIGGQKAIQYEAAFKSTLDSLVHKVHSDHKNVKVTVEFMDTKGLCEKKWEPCQLMDWLLNAHIHFLTAHAHQGLRTHMLFWDMTVLTNELQRLKYHVGFPSGDQLRCPIFTQQKYQYLYSLETMANNTLCVPLTSSGQYDESTLSNIQR
jgi:hypothetical protein